jgi:ABC-type multidrug transport system ATPase subunit
MGRGGTADRTVLTAWARGVEARYGTRPPALSALDLELAPGQVVALLGPNGSGKSTLLRLLATVMRPSAGSLTVLGRDSRRADAALRRSIGWAPDEPAHLESLSGYENAWFFARASGVPEVAARSRVEHLLKRLSLDRVAQRPVAEYSMGMRRKLALVEAMAHQPPLLVLDEPTTALDLPSREALRALIGDQAGGGSCVVLATNEVSEAELLAQRVVFLAGGRKALEGNPGELIARLGGDTRVEVRYTGAPATPAPAVTVPGLSVAAADGEHLIGHSRDGTAVLAPLCAALAAAGFSIGSIDVRRPDLADVFLKATGVELAPPPGSRAA